MLCRCVCVIYAYSACPCVYVLYTEQPPHHHHDARPTHTHTHVVQGCWQQHAGMQRCMPCTVPLLWHVWGVKAVPRQRGPWLISLQAGPCGGSCCWQRALWKRRARHKMWSWLHSWGIRCGRCASRDTVHGTCRGRDEVNYQNIEDRHIHGCHHTHMHRWVGSHADKVLAALVLSGAQPAAKQAKKELAKVVKGKLDDWIAARCPPTHH